MSWFKVDLDLFEHRKFVGLSLPAVGLWLRGGTFAVKYRTEGFVSREVVRVRRWPKKLIEELIRNHLWEVVDGGYRIHDFLDYQPDREGRLPRDRRVEQGGLSSVRAQAGRRGAERRWQREHDSNLPSDDGKPDGNDDGKPHGKLLSTLPPVFSGSRSSRSLEKTENTGRARDSFTAAGPVFQSLLDVLKPR